ncbi:MAG: hypothetical protein A3H98_09305 [Bacteroidetes bacterium RIFCSPLOWO2_02_FULL_36_8]|nr:MAG: hypothetical protein A3H98_09305 [Bacteroidetes bacterium RIFCSPLOWO2_02_FULL_36_8]OFY69148.1 MAG: hypothetical protein A3G23_06265 [Bacteroidetes bacterium RIFCSPLOWO2_12_FULL_37_12]
MNFFNPTHPLIKKIIVQIMCLFCILPTAYCQSSFIDSLTTRLSQTLHDTDRVNTLNALSWKLQYNNPDTSIILSTQALSIAKGIQWKKGTAISLSELGVYNFLKNYFPEALKFHFAALKIDEALNNKKGMSIRLGNIGLAYWKQGDYRKALDYHFRALKISEELGDKNKIAMHLGNIGIVYDEQADYPNALDYYFRALKIRTELGNKNEITNTLGNIGVVYHNQADYPKALKFYFKALNSAEEMDNKILMSIWLANIGIVYREQDDYLNALNYYFRALKIDEEIGNKNGLAYNYGNIGIVYLEQADAPIVQQRVRDSLLKSALDYFSRALTIGKEVGDKNGIARHLGNIGSLYATTGKFKEAEEYLIRALTLSDSIGTLDHSRNFELSLSHIYDTTGRTQLAFEHYKKYCATKDSIFNEEKSKDIGKLEARHEWEMNELEAHKLLEKQKRETLIAMERRNLLRYSAIVLLLVTLVVGLLYSRRLLAWLPDKIRVSRKGAKTQRWISVNKQGIVFGLLFATVFLVFETINVYFDEDIERITRSNVIWKTVVSCLFAGMVSLVYFFFERRLEKKLGFEKINISHENTKTLNPTKLISIFLVGFSVFVLSWQNKTDSLKAELKKNIADTTRINTLNALFSQYINSAPDTAFDYAQKALEFSKNIKWKKGLANSFHSIGHYYYTQADYPNAIKFWFIALRINEKLKDKPGISRSLGNIGSIYTNQSNYPMALEYYFRALKIDEELLNKNGIARHLGNIGNVYKDQTDYPKALDYYLRALKVDEESGKKIGIATDLGNIGIIYSEQKEYSKALDYYLRALKIREEIGAKNLIASTLGNIGNLYYSLSDYPKALEYYFRALKTGEEIGDKNRIAILLLNIGNVYNDQVELSSEGSIKTENIKKALYYYFQALKMDKELSAKNLFSLTLCNIGSLYTKTGKFNEAEEYLKYSLAIADTLGSLERISLGHQIISVLYDTTGRTQLAFEHYKKYIAAKDSIFNEEKSKDIGKLEMKHELEIAEFERHKKEEEETRLAKLEKTREDKIGYSFILIAVLVLLGGVTLLVRISLPQSLLQIATTVPFLLLFETVIVFMNPYIEQFAANDPAWKLGANFVLSLVIYPIHERVERFVRRRVGRRN